MWFLSLSLSLFFYLLGFESSSHGESGGIEPPSEPNRRRRQGRRRPHRLILPHIVGVPATFNILRYEIGQRYASHYDAFHPEQYGLQKSNRVATFLLYLIDVEEGGEIMFPFENGLNMDIDYDYEKCIGLRVKPKRGDGLLFYSMLTNGTIDLILETKTCTFVWDWGSSDESRMRQQQLCFSFSAV